MMYFENEAAIIFVLPEQKLAITKWKGFASTDELKQLLNEALLLMDKYSIYYWLNDNRQMKVIRPADQEYIVNEWMPKFIKRSDVKKSATIESFDIFSKISSDNILRKADQLIPFHMGTFDSFNDAIEWLGFNMKEEEIYKRAA